MELPRNIELPFFAYGLFRPGQLAFFQIRDLVSETVDPSVFQGILLLRDGLPIIDSGRDGRVTGALITFLPGRAREAYSRISDMEPEEAYRWDEGVVDGTPANVLVGRSPQKGSDVCETEEWNGWDDPLFNEALEVVEESLKSHRQFEWNLKPLFRLQMAYLLLWSSIERYVSLRYHLGRKVTDKVRQFAAEPAFAESLERNVKGTRYVYRADRPADRASLDPKNPEKSIQYYYQIRSNITHRGKGVVRDHELLCESLAELLVIFRDVLRAAKDDATPVTSGVVK
jgi:hypothetical protein